MQDITLLTKILFTTTAVEPSDFIKFGSSYEAYKTKKEELERQWRAMEDEEKRKKNYKKFLASGLSEIDYSEGVKNFKLFNEEVKARKDAGHLARFLGVDSLGSNKSLMDILEGYENATILKRLYKDLNLTVGKEKNSGIDTGEAENIKYCMRQEGNYIYQVCLVVI